MTRLEEKVEVAKNCSHYRQTENSFVSCLGSSSSKSCDRCRHFNNELCSLDVYDRVLQNLN